MQADATKPESPQLPMALKNKALLCKPVTQTKATSCKPHIQHKECQAGTCRCTVPCAGSVFWLVGLGFLVALRKENGHFFPEL